MYLKIGKEKRKINKKNKLLITLNIQSKYYILRIIRSLSIYCVYNCFYKIEKYISLKIIRIRYISSYLLHLFHNHIYCYSYFYLMLH